MTKEVFSLSHVRVRNGERRQVADEVKKSGVIAAGHNLMHPEDDVFKASLGNLVESVSK